MSVQINIASVEDIREIDKCNRAVLPENYDESFYQSLFSSPNCCNFVVRFSDKPPAAATSTLLSPAAELAFEAASEATTATAAVATATPKATAELAVASEPKEEKDVVITPNNVTVSDKPIENGKLAGYILAAVQNDAKGALVGHVFSLGVYPQYRRKQFATVLLRCVETMLKERYPELKYMVLHMRKHNKTAYSFYTKNGFGRAGMEKKYYVKPVEDAYVMKKYFA